MSRVFSHRGVTIIEVLVAAFIFVIISGGIYTVLRSTRQVAHVSQAKDEAKAMAETILKYMQQDIAVSRAVVDKNPGGGGKPKATPSFSSSGGEIRMQVPKPGIAAKMEDDYVNVVYSLSGKTLHRDDGVTGNNRLLSKYVSKLNAFLLSDSQVEIEVEIEIFPVGVDTPVTHNQRVLVTIREAIVNAVDKRWLSSDEITAY
ncbi:MAG TPA: hypothetical protein DCG57_12800 [Candidatus Riflebacteria bacterium]|jgi:prepilin-type N-terminal cleavage/methylation domain-containing protein|nr:hypothetical protein [Candidatus Riflebacteria bacterium]